MLKGPSSRAVFAGLTGLLTYPVGGTAIGYLSVGLLTVLVPAAIVVGAVPVAGAGLIVVLYFGAGLSAARGLEKGDASRPAVPGVSDDRAAGLGCPGGP